jgi:transcriptional regulator GlxA family with amidase domain
VHTLQRLAWEILFQRVQSGQLGAPQAWREFRTLVNATEQEPWLSVTGQLRVRHSRNETSVASRIRDFVDAHSAEKLTLTRLARAVGCSVRSSTTAFKTRYGVSIIEYLIRRRLVQATTLLLSTDLKLAAIAEAIGFKDKATLHRHFVRRTGLTPRALHTAEMTPLAMACLIGVPEAERRRKPRGQ